MSYFTELPSKRVRELDDHDAIGAFRSKLLEAEDAGGSGAEWTALLLALNAPE